MSVYLHALVSYLNEYHNSYFLVLTTISLVVISYKCIFNKARKQSNGYRLYGSKISYFTGKLEAYLRYKGIEYEFIPMTSIFFKTTVVKETGVSQMPALQLPDNRWLTDTTPIIEYFESNESDSSLNVSFPVIPKCPVQGFVSRLLEDYADEWLWRPAMYYRWSYPEDIESLSTTIGHELMSDLPLPFFLKKLIIYSRQFNTFVRNDGVTSVEMRNHLQDIYIRTLRHLNNILEKRSFLLGERPTLSDFGFMASMFRHFSMDPTPAKIMKDSAPNVYKWVSNMWSIRQLDGKIFELLKNIEPLEIS